jgi:hypothetical protein
MKKPTKVKCEQAIRHLCVNRRDRMTPLESISSDSCGADRRRDPGPKHNVSRRLATLLSKAVAPLGAADDGA